MAKRDNYRPIALQPCEVAAREVVPSIRALIARIMVTEYGLSKYEAAKMIGVSPATISNYLNGKRREKYVARIASDKDKLDLVREAAFLVVSARRDEETLARLQDITCAICSSVNEAAQALGCRHTRYTSARS